MKLIPKTKDGKAIQGAFEKIQATAPFSHATRNEDGSLELHYEGESKVFWDTSETQKMDGERLYLCEEGTEHKESELVWEEEPYVPGVMTLQRFRDLTRHLHPDSRIGISYDALQWFRDVIAIREPDSEGGETIIDCGELEALESE